MIPVLFVKTMELYEACRLMVTNEPYDSVVLIKFALQERIKMGGPNYVIGSDWAVHSCNSWLFLFMLH